MANIEFPKLKSVKTGLTDAPLTDEEIDKFIGELDVDKDGNISFSELEARLEAVLEELSPEPKAHHLNHPTRRKSEKPGDTSKLQDLEKGSSNQHREHDGIHAFLLQLMPSVSEAIPKEEFRERVKTWNIPSQKKGSAKEQHKDALEYSRRLKLARRVRAFWTMNGPRMLWLTMVVCLILAFGLWQLMKYARAAEVRAALDWGVVMAKGFAGALYPTLFFMLLSMSRWFGTACRRFYYLSRLVDWDRHQSFHIWMACLALFFASMHAIGHLTGTFVDGSRPENQEAFANILGPDAVPKPYVKFVRSLPGWTGLTALGLFWTIAITSEPHVRKMSYELFQAGHILMFPMIGLICAHGAAKLLQYPMLGFWLIVPGLLVVTERLHRLYRGIVAVPADLMVQDEETVIVTCHNPSGQPWRYSAGQYVFLQVPKLGFFQWHPFTISHCADDIFQLHIKTDGNWTGKLRDLDGAKDLRVGIDGPFGAPAQRFYEYNRSLIIGAGVGVTPFSAIISDLEQDLKVGRETGWDERESRPSTSSGRRSSRSRSRRRSLFRFVDDDSDDEAEGGKFTPKKSCSRRVDFHWMVRDKNSLLWFSDLLNRAYDVAKTLPEGELDLNLHTHVTMKRDNISQHIFRYLLDAYRTPTCPVSALTGLKARSHFGRPDFEKILGNFHEDVRQEIKDGNAPEGEKIAVFFCGTPVIGEVLSDVCHQLTLKGKEDGSNIRWDFRIEVFG